MNDLLVVYNICGILHDNTDKYIHYLDTIVSQNYGKVIVSACMPRPRTIPTLRDRFPSLEFVSVEENLPVNVTFNYSVLQAIKKYGPFHSYAYVSCDSYCHEPNQLENLHRIILDDPEVGLVCPRLINDSGYAFGLKLGSHRFDDFGASLAMFMEGNYTIPIGRAVNAHTLIYSGKIQEFYGRCCPDIFKGFCTESVLSFVAGAIGLKWVISNSVVMGHDVGLDTPSAGQDVQEYSKTRPSHDHPFVIPSILERVQNEKAISLGFGYEECQNIVLHDSSQWDGYHCRNNELKDYIKQNIYLQPSEFDYSNIKGEYVA